MRRKISQIIMIITVLLMLFLPSVLMCVNSLFNLEIGKNRHKVVTPPALSMNNIGKFPGEYENWLDNNHPFHDDLKTFWAKFNFGVFKESGSSGVVVGRSNGADEETWLFYSDDTDQNPIKDAQGVSAFRDSLQNCMAHNATKYTELLEQKGIDLYYLVIPNKENTYREMLPDSIKIYDVSSRVDKVIEKIAKGANVIYLKSVLNDKKETGQLYYAQDTHWNDYGAYVGFKEVLAQIEPSYKMAEAKVSFNKKQINRDLVGPMGLYDYFVDNIPTVEYLPEQNYEVVEKNDAVIVTKNENAPIEKTLMVVGDSYRQNLPQFFAKTFKRTVFIDRRKYKPNMLEQYGPDTVLALFVERYAGSICELALMK
ncbi:hypothetical protein IJG91_03400 [Candidatus Saccharibacteria bacterium]|nr:hypothetical protein [Candidatus Saccharibacteria bacterium]